MHIISFDVKLFCERNCMDDLPHQQMGFLLQKNVKWAILAIEKVPPNALFPPELGYTYFDAFEICENSWCTIETELSSG